MSSRADGSLQQNVRFETLHPSGQVHERGDLRNGLRSGVWESWHENGSLESRGSYLLGKPEGVWIHRTPAGGFDDELTGVYENGEKIAAWYEDQIREGQLNSGVFQRSQYKHGLRNGAASSFYPSGQKEGEGQYLNGLMSGPWTFWNEDGTVDSDRTGRYEHHQRVGALAAKSSSEVAQ